MENEKRDTAHKKPLNLESVLRRLEELLAPVEESLYKGRRYEGDFPRLYIMGCARSGTTLVYQYLASSGFFVYPTNFLSRFYYAPYLGSLIQKALVEYDFKQEVITSDYFHSFQSTLGKTKGALAPHEFWYYWRQFFPVLDHQNIDHSRVANGAGEKFVTGLKSVQADAGKPLVLKGMYLNWEIEFLDHIDNNAFFINVFRDPVDNALSLLEARKNFFGNYDEWYSFKPLGYQKVLHLSPEHQTLWQVLTTNASIRAQQLKLAKGNYLEFPYQDFCSEPRKYLGDLLSRINIKGEVNAEPTNFVYKTGKRSGRDWSRILDEIQPYL